MQKEQSHVGATGKPSSNAEQRAAVALPAQGDAPCWTQAEAIELCRLVEAVCVAQGDCHVALTGGLLYKDGPRKDCDLLFYRVRQADWINVEGLFTALFAIGLQRTRVPDGEHFVVKATWRGRNVDCLFPEVASGDYTNDSNAAAQSAAAAVIAEGAVF
jgi:hypothetical protein